MTFRKGSSDQSDLALLPCAYREPTMPCAVGWRSGRLLVAAMSVTYGDGERDPLRAAMRAQLDHAYNPRPRAMISFWISVVPPKKP